jgi:hypothetical protein
MVASFTPRSPAGRRAAHPALEPLAHGVAGGVEALVADDDGVEVEAVLLGVPAALVGAAEDAQQLGRVDPAGPRDAVLAVGRERHVLGLQGSAGADLRGLLAQQRHPDAQLALPLQGVALAVEAADQHHVAVQRLQRRYVDVADPAVEPGVGDPLALRGQQLDQVRAAVGAAQPGDHLFPGLARAGRGLGGRGPVLRNGHVASWCSATRDRFVAARAATDAGSGHRW